MKGWCGSCNTSEAPSIKDTPQPWQLDKHLSPHWRKGLEGIEKAAIYYVNVHIVSGPRELQVMVRQSDIVFYRVHCDLCHCCTLCVMRIFIKSDGRNLEIYRKEQLGACSLTWRWEHWCHYNAYVQNLKLQPEVMNSHGCSTPPISLWSPTLNLV